MLAARSPFPPATPPTTSSRRRRTPQNAQAVAAGATPEKPRKNQIVVNLSTCKYEILRKVAQTMGWRESIGDEAWDLYWTDLSVSEDRVMRMKGHQKINHFPGMSELCRKCNLARNMRRMHDSLPGEFQFYPQSWCLPDELAAFRATLAKNPGPYVVKPDAGCQGRGIFLISNSDDLRKISPRETYVVQKYIDNPMLIDKLKFDLRIYVLVVSCDPLRVFVHREGLARFCTEPYSVPDALNSSNSYMHLTNYAINKHHQRFMQGGMESSSSTAGHKRRLDSVFESLRQQGVNTDRMWKEIEGLVVKTLLVGQPLLSRSFRNCSVSTKEIDTFRCFELLGFDIILDDAAHPHLLEVNHSPSFTCDSEIDIFVKENILSDLMRMLNLTKKTKRRSLAKGRREAEVRLFSGLSRTNVQTKIIIKPVEISSENSKQQKAAKFIDDVIVQEKNTGGFTRVYPHLSSGEDTYSKIENVIYTRRAQQTSSRHLGFVASSSQNSSALSSTLERLALKTVHTEHGLTHAEKSDILFLRDGGPGPHSVFSSRVKELVSTGSVSAYNIGYSHAMQSLSRGRPSSSFGETRRPVTASVIHRTPALTASALASPLSSRTPPAQKSR